MKYLSILIIAFLTQSNHAPAQDTWFEQPSGTSSSLYSVYFLDENSGWIGGSDNVLKKSTNGGNSWENTAFHGSQTSKWYCIYFVSSSYGYAAGSVYNYDRWQSNWARTSNGGSSWEWQTSWGNEYSSTQSLFFLNENTGWKVGPRNGDGMLYKTTSGISGWYSLPSLPEPMYSVWFTDAQNGWCAGSYGAIYATTNGGSGWVSLNSDSTISFKSVCFIDLSKGWVVGYGNNQAVILKTVNGGQTWDTVFPSTIKELHSVVFVDKNTGWACGKMESTPTDKGVILGTTNGGTNWEVQHVNDNCSVFYALHFINNSVGWAVGSNGIIAKTTTGGLTDVKDINKLTPADYSLLQNYPNPFNPATIIKYTIPEKTWATLTVYNILGRKVAGLLNGETAPGYHQVEFNGSNLASGIYFYRLAAGSFTQIKKMILIK